MILKLDIDNTSVSEYMTPEDIMNRLIPSDEIVDTILTNTILTLGLAISGQAIQHFDTLEDQQYFILAITNAANKIVSSFEQEDDEDAYDE